jgi:hypothetical protein
VFDYLSTIAAGAGIVNGAAARARIAERIVEKWVIAA